MSEPRCCICDAPAGSPYHVLGGRVYCDRHFAVVNKPHPGFWRAGVVQIAGMAAFASLLAWLAGFLGPLEGAPLLLAGAFLALAPSALWLGFFYRQDRLEPEPKTRIAAVFIVAMLLGEALGMRVIYQWFQTPLWAAADTLTSLLASVLIVGFTWQGIAYATVRAVVYATPEFDERMDGIVYGTVAGLGLATLQNVHYVFDNQGVALAPGVIRTVTTALAQASFGGLMGYFLAEARFTHRPLWWVPLGVALAAAANGLFSWLISEVSASGLTVDPWRSLGLGLTVALGCFVVLLALMRRALNVQR